MTDNDLLLKCVALTCPEIKRAFMSKEKELVRNTAIITIGKICTQFLSFFLLPLYTSILTTSEYGTTDLLSTYQIGRAHV